MEFNDKQAIYLQIKNYLYQKIISKKFPLSSHLPSVRKLATELSVNPNTVQRALREMVKEKVLITKRGTGNYVTSNKKMIENLKNKLLCQALNNFYQQISVLNLKNEDIVTNLEKFLKKGESNGK